MTNHRQKIDRAVERYISYTSAFPKEAAEYELSIGEDVLAHCDTIEDDKAAQHYMEDRVDDLRKWIGKGSSQQINRFSLVTTIATIVQSLGKRFNLLLYGDKVTLVQTVKDNEDQFNSLLKEIACKYAMDKFVEPEARLGLLSAQCIYNTHAINTAHKKSLALNIESDGRDTQSNSIQSTAGHCAISSSEQLQSESTNTTP